MNFTFALCEITSNGGKIDLTSMQPTNGGDTLEAEDVANRTSVVETKLNGFARDGYVGNGDGHAKQSFTWNYNASESGRYILEFRYTLNREDAAPFKLDINGKEVAEIQLWNCGNTGNWLWERVTVDLSKGANTISIAPERFILLDHLNVIGIGK